jgi:hypothetical protein
MRQLQKFVPIFLLIGGCALRPDAEVMVYPTTWPPLRGSGSLGCNAFAGVYRTTGENAQRSPNGVNSPTLLSVLGLPGAKNSPFVSIQPNSEGSAYQLAPLDALEKPIAVTGVSEPVVCDEGNLVRHFGVGGYADGTNSKAKWTVTLSLTSNGFLVAHAIGNVQSSDLLFSSSTSYDLFYKFARAPGTE